jgi:glucose-1-phosphate thymidylyltransferase
MRIVIPVAGSGTRLRPHTYSHPKPLLLVGGKPIIAHLLDPVVKLDPDEVIFVIGYRGQQVREYVEANYSFKATFVEQDKLLGLGYALNLAIQRIDSGEVLVLLGDTVVECDLREFVEAGDNVLGVLPVDDPHRFGIVTVEGGQVTRLVEKPEMPESNLAIIGLYYFCDVAPLKTAMGEHVESGQMTQGEIQFTDALQTMLDGGVRFVTHEVAEWFDCGTKDTMLTTNEHLVATLGPPPEIEGSVINGPVCIHPEVEVVNSIIGPSVSIAERTLIQNSIVSNSIIGRDCRITNMILKDSLIGNNATLTGTSRVLNLGDSSEIEPG